MRTNDDACILKCRAVFRRQHSTIAFGKGCVDLQHQALAHVTRSDSRWFKRRLHRAQRASQEFIVPCRVSVCGAQCIKRNIKQPVSIKRFNHGGARLAQFLRNVG